MLVSLLNWFSQLEAPVKAAIIVGCTTILTVILGFVIKDYFIPIYLEKRRAKAERVSVFRNYRTPLIDSATSLKTRLDEIFRTRAHILWKDNPINDFYNYKFISTGYRLCSLLGWIYAFRLEESYLQVPSKKLHNQIKGQLNAFSKSLADGQGVEMDIANRFITLFNIDKTTLKEGDLEKFSVKIDHLIHKALSSPEDKQLLSEVSEETQSVFLSSLSILIKQLFEIELDEHKLKELNVINEASVKLGLIYRDWQQGIGDLMIKERKRSSGRAYDVLSFREFENMISINNSENQNRVWFDRTMRLFTDLDVSIENRFDNRIEQLRRINETLLNLIIALERCTV